MLKQGSMQDGFALALISISQAAEVPLGIRQLAAVLLRRHIRKRWSQEAADDEEHRCISDSEKAQVRAMLPAGLADGNSRIQTAVSMAIAEVAKWDSSDQWPELIPGLVQTIISKSNPTLGKILVDIYVPLFFLSCICLVGWHGFERET